MMYRVAIEHADNYRLETVKAALRRCFDDLGFPEKNPLGKIIQPGNSVFIKPNWVASRWRESCPHKDTLYSVITHPSVIEAVCDYVSEALTNGGGGIIIIGDNPSIDANFEELMNFTGIRERLMNKYDVEVEIKDLRPLVCDDLKNYGKRDKMIHQNGDDTVKINLGSESLFYGISPENFRGVFDEREDTIASHTGETQLYTFSKSLYDADVYISIPKLKTHQKIGATLNIKGLVGSIADKNQLVHWRTGYPEINGDEYPSREAWQEGNNARVKHRGAWPGNDTIWRMAVDLYHGMMKRERRYFSVIDGIVAGEGQGPFCPTSKNANTIIAGEDLLAVDIAGVRYMGFDPEKIKYLNYFLETHTSLLNEIEIIHDGVTLPDFFVSESKYLDFHTTKQWDCIKKTSV